MLLSTCRVDIKKEDITNFTSYDAIVNACTRQLGGKDGVSKAIHIAAGPKLLQACKKIGSCETGDAKITKGYNLSKYVIHAVGPYDLDKRKLRRCYTKSLGLAEENECRSVIFPCIATGKTHAYNARREEAANVALKAVKDYLMDKQILGKMPFVSIVFCVHSKNDEEIYNRCIPAYFNREPNYVPRQPNYPVQVAPSRLNDNGRGQPGDATNGGQTYFFHEVNYVPMQQNYPAQVLPVGHRDSIPQKPDNTANGGQTYYQREFNYVPVQQNQGVQAAHGQRNIHLQKPDDMNNGGQTYFNGEPSYTPRQHSYPVAFAPVAHRNTRLQKPDDATDGGQRHYRMRQARNS